MAQLDQLPAAHKAPLAISSRKRFVRFAASRGSRVLAHRCAELSAQLIADHVDYLRPLCLGLVEKLVVAAIDGDESSIGKCVPHPPVAGWFIDHRLDAGADHERATVARCRLPDPVLESPAGERAAPVSRNKTRLQRVGLDAIRQLRI